MKEDKLIIKPKRIKGDDGYRIFSIRIKEEIVNQIDEIVVQTCIFRKNCASVPEERSAIPLETEQSSAS